MRIRTDVIEAVVAVCFAVLVWACVISHCYGFTFIGGKAPSGVSCPADTAGPGFRSATPGARIGDLFFDNTVQYRAWARPFTTPTCTGGGPTISAIGCYLDEDNAGTAEVKFTIYTDDAGNTDPEDNISGCTTAPITVDGSTMTKYEVAVSGSCVLSSNTTYWIVVMETSAANNLDIDWDNDDDPVECDYFTHTGGNWQDNQDWSEDTVGAQMYAIYAE